MKYFVKLTRDKNGVVVTCRDLPAMNSVGTDVDDALLEAVDGIQTALGLLIDDRREIPEPSKAKRGEHAVELPALAVAKIGLYNAMRSKGINRAKLASLLGVHLEQVARLLDPCHKSKLDQVEAALKAVGYRMDIRVLEAA